MWVPSLVLLRGLRIWGDGVGRGCSSTLARELPNAAGAGAAIKGKKKKWIFFFQMSNVICLHCRKLKKHGKIQTKKLKLLHLEITKFFSSFLCPYLIENEPKMLPSCIHSLPVCNASRARIFFNHVVTVNILLHEHRYLQSSVSDIPFMRFLYVLVLSKKTKHGEFPSWRSG